MKVKHQWIFVIILIGISHGICVTVSWSKIRKTQNNILSKGHHYNSFTARNSFECLVGCMNEKEYNCMAISFVGDILQCNTFAFQRVFTAREGSEKDEFMIIPPETGIALYVNRESTSVNEAAEDCKRLGGHIMSLAEFAYYRTVFATECRCGWVEDGTQRRLCATNPDATCSLLPERRIWCTVYP